MLYGHLDWLSTDSLLSLHAAVSWLLLAQAVRQHFERVLAAIPASLAFSIDDITGDVTGGTGTSQGAPLTVGLTWHVGKAPDAFPHAGRLLSRTVRGP